MKIHRPILWNIIKFLPGRDLLNARRFDSFWEDMIPDILYEKERNAVSPFREIDLTVPSKLQRFIRTFAEGSPPMGASLLQFGNLHFLPCALPSLELERFAALHGPFLRFATITNSYFRNLSKVKSLLNNLKSLEKLTLLGNFFHNELDSIDVELAILPNLAAIDSSRYHLLCYNSPIGKLLHEVVGKAPRLRWISISISIRNYTGPSNLPLTDFLRPFQHIACVSLYLHGPTTNVFQDLAHSELRIHELKLSSYHGASDNFDEAAKTFSEWLGRRQTLEVLKIKLWSRGDVVARVQFPPILNIRIFKIGCLLKTPLLASQVPNL